jgi:hypothetical protein
VRAGSATTYEGRLGPARPQKASVTDGHDGVKELGGFNEAGRTAGAITVIGPSPAGSQRRPAPGLSPNRAYPGKRSTRRVGRQPYRRPGGLVESGEKLVGGTRVRTAGAAEWAAVSDDRRN